MSPALVLRHIRWALLAMILMVAAGAGAVHFANEFLRHAQAEQRVAQAARADSQGKLSRAREEEQELRATAARFHELEQRGILGEEHRLDWVERIRGIRDAHRLFDLQYEIAPQQPMPDTPAGRYQFMVSPMRLNLMLLHEEDLERLLADLPASVPAYVRTRRCSMERLPPPAQPPAGAAPLLKAECELDWITIRAPQSGPGAKS